MCCIPCAISQLTFSLLSKYKICLGLNQFLFEKALPYYLLGTRIAYHKMTTMNEDWNMKQTLDRLIARGLISAVRDKKRHTYYSLAEAQNV